MQPPRKPRAKHSVMNLKMQIITLTVTSIFATAVLILLISLWQNTKNQQLVQQEVSALSQGDLDHIANSVATLIQTQDESIQQKVNDNLNVARYVLEQQGGIHTASETVVWEAINQLDQSVQSVRLPKLMAGDTWLGQNTNADQETEVVDTLQNMAGGTATIFQRMNASGDLLRVATNVKKLDNTRAIGTYIPAVNADGSANAVVAAVLNGQTYHGVAFVVNAWYITAYEPIYNQNQEVIGALYVGVKQENLSTLREAIMNIQVGKSGYVFVLGGQGDDRGHYIISKDGERDGENIWDSLDADQNAIIQKIINQAILLKPGETFTERYRWQNPGETQAEWKIVRVAYYEPWDWVICVGAYEADVNAYQQRLSNDQRNSIFIMIGAAVLIIMAGVLMASQRSKKISDPLQGITTAMSQLAQQDFRGFVREMQLLSEGDLTRSMQFDHAELPVGSMDEVGQITLAFNAMVTSLTEISTRFNQVSANLREMIGQVAENAAGLGVASGQLAASAQQSGQASAQIATTVQQVAKGAVQQASSVMLAVSSVEQMSRAIDGVAKGAQEQSAGIGKAAEITNQLSNVIQAVAVNAQTQVREAAQAVEVTQTSSLKVEETIAGMQRIQSQVNLSTQKVHEMGERSQEIGLIVETIGDIASQTNLLALNAAIEAARAGAHGKGFAVVADEVRKLAEKSATATKEISALIASIQNTVADAVQAMQGSTSEVSKGVLLANQSGQALKSILDTTLGTQKTGENIASAAEKMNSLANVLVGAMDSVSAVVEENTAATEEMAAGSNEVSEAVENIASISEENSAAVQEVSASAEETSAQMEEVSTAAQTLAGMAETLQQVVSRFKLAKTSMQDQAILPNKQPASVKRSY